MRTTIFTTALVLAAASTTLAAPAADDQELDKRQFGCVFPSPVPAQSTCAARGTRPSCRRPSRAGPSTILPQLPLADPLSAPSLSRSGLTSVLGDVTSVAGDITSGAVGAFSTLTSGAVGAFSTVTSAGATGFECVLLLVLSTPCRARS